MLARWDSDDGRVIITLHADGRVMERRGDVESLVSQFSGRYVRRPEAMIRIISAMLTPGFDRKEEG